jgi:hypothetical protein
MEHMGSAFIALAVVLAVAIAAFSFKPANPLEPWLRLATSYATPRQPSQMAFVNQDVQFGGKRGGLKNLAIAAKFDATVDDFGFWLAFKGPLPEDCPATLKIPGTHVRYVSEVGNLQVFELFASPPVTIGVRGELGDALRQRCQPAAS